MPGLILTGASKSVVDIDGRPVVYFGGTNYLGLSYHQDVIMAAQEGLIRWGLSSSGSRETTGGASVHDQLEQRLAEFLGRSNAVTCCSGYLMNLILLQALKESYSVCLLADSAHCSLTDAAAGSGMPTHTFRCGDPEDLAEKLQRHCTRKGALICCDGVLSSGELAPLDAYHEQAVKWNSALVVDDAHGFGVLGKRGRGTLEHYGIDGKHSYQTGTLSKAFGCFGGYAAGEGSLARLVRHCSDAYVGSSPTPPAIAAASIAAIDIVQGDTSLRTNLAKNIEVMKSGLRSIGIECNTSPSPVAAFVIGSRSRNEQVHAALLKENYLIPYNFYPGGPKTGRFRMAVTAKHTSEQIKRVLELLGNLISVGEV